MTETNKIQALEDLIGSLVARVATLEEIAGDRELIYKGISVVEPGNTSWKLTSTALVLFMTIPGLALYYSGMVRAENVLSTIMQIFSITCMITFLWLCFGYSLAFGPADPNETGSPVYGDASRFWLRGMTVDSVHQVDEAVPEAVFCAFQLTFAIITPALICGSFADRMKYVPMLVFMSLWHLCVYCPMAHSFWHPDGWLYKLNALDYAGGCVVHISAGMSGLMSTLIVGNRRGFLDPKLAERFQPHNILFTFIGTCMIWVGWYGFNAGSAVGADGTAATALLNTQIAAGVAGLSFLGADWIYRSKPSVLAIVNGSVAGLVTITPACGYVNPTGAFFCGLIGGVACFFGSQLKFILKLDDALDAFGIHAVGGITGGILTGFFATRTVNDYEGVFYSSTGEGGRQLGKQVLGIVIAAVWASVVSLVLLKGLDMVMGLRVTAEEEDMGIDRVLHGESIIPKERRAVRKQKNYHANTAVPVSSLKNVNGSPHVAIPNSEMVLDNVPNGNGVVDESQL